MHEPRAASDRWFGRLLVCLGAIVLFVIGARIGRAVARYDMRRAAVQAGVAEWIADGQGAPSFQWRQP